MAVTHVMDIYAIYSNRLSKSKTHILNSITCKFKEYKLWTARITTAKDYKLWLVGFFS